MAATQTATKRISFEEYLQLERDTDQRYEFYEGEVFAIAGESLRHNDIAGNIYSSFRSAVREQGCRIQIENIKVELESHNYYVYPDVVVSCHPDDLEEEYFIKHPSILIEVLSPSTESYDRKIKLQRYGRVPSVKHVALVHQKFCFVEVFTKEAAPKNFYYRAYDSLSDVIDFADLSLQLSLSAVYESIRFDPQPSEQ